MNNFQKNGLPSRKTIIQKRNITLDSSNNVLQPNKLKTDRIITNNLYKEHNKNRIQKINNGNTLMNKSWNTKG